MSDEPPDDAVTHAVISLLAEHKKADPTGWTADTVLADIGVDSLDLIEFLFLVEERYGIVIDFNANQETGAITTVGDIARRAPALGGQNPA